MGNEAEVLLSTTQAADIIYGGVKVNALEKTTLMV